MAFFATTKLTYSNPGIRLELLLKELSKRSGQELACSPVLKNEVIVCSFENQSVETVKEKLATVIHATWREKDGFATLVQTDDQKREEYRWHQKYFYRFIDAQLKGYEMEGVDTELTLSEADQLSKLSSLPEEARSEKKELTLKMNRLSPFRRLMARIVKKLKPEHFGPDSLFIGVKAFSFEPKPFATMVPVDVKQEMQMFERDMELLDRFKNQENTSKSRSTLSVTLHMVPDTFPNLSFLMLRNGGYLGERGNQEILKEILNPKKQEFPEPEEILSVAKALRTSTSVNHEKSADPLSERIRLARKSLLHADRIDPLAHVQGARWLAFSEFKGRSLIVSLSENQLSGIPSSENRDDAIGEVRIDSNSWILGRPADPLGNRRWRVDRIIAKRVYEKLADQGSIKTLSEKLQDQYAQFVALRLSSGVPYVSPFILDTMGEDCAIFALYKVLTPNIHRRLERGETIPFSKLECTNPDVHSFWTGELVRNRALGFNTDSMNETLFSASSSQVPVFIVENEEYSQDLELKKAAFWLNDYKSATKRQKDIETMKIWCETADCLRIKIGSGEGYTVTLRSDVTKTTKPYTYATLPPKLKAEMERAFGSN